MQRKLENPQMWRLRNIVLNNEEFRKKFKIYKINILREMKIEIQNKTQGMQNNNFKMDVHSDKCLHEENKSQLNFIHQRTRKIRTNETQK